MTIFSRAAADDWVEVTVDDLKAPTSNALATGPFGSSIGSRYFVSAGIPVIRGSNLAKDGTTPLVEDDFVFLSPEKAAEFQRSTVVPGDLVFTCWGTINQIGLISASSKFPRYVISNKQMKLTPDPGRVDSRFLFYLFSSPGVQRTILDQSIGSSVPGFNLGQLRAMRLRVPARLEEQKAIAEALSDIDALIGALDRLISKKRDLKQAVMHQLLTGQTRLPGFQGECWRLLQLGQVASFHKGKGLSKNELNPAGPEPAIHYGELFTFYGATILQPKSRTHGRNHYFRSVANDVLMPTSDVTPNGLAKASCVLVDGIVIGGDILVIRTEPTSVCGVFLSYLIRNSEPAILSLVSGTTVYHLYASDMKRFCARLPSRAEQAAIVEVISDLDAEINALEERRNKTRLIKQGMMQELLTGRTRLL